MYRELERRGFITTNNFRDIRTQVLDFFTSESMVVQNLQYDNYLTRENVEKIIGNFSKSLKPEVVVRLVIFCLVVYYGLTKSQAEELLLQSWECVDWDKKTIMYNGNSVYKKRCYKNRQNAVFSTLNSCFTIQLFATIDNYFIQFSHALFSINLCVIYYAVCAKIVIFIMRLLFCKFRKVH